MSQAKKAFIAGPIIGMEEEQGYRQIIGKICRHLGYELIDPWNREQVLYKGDEACWRDKDSAKGFVQRDLEDADRCDVMIVYLPRLSAGACMEMFYAKRRGKKIIVISTMKCLSPWIVVHSDAILKRFDDLEETLRQLM